MAVEFSLKDKSIVVTGGAGFLGREVTRVLAKKGATKFHVPRSADYDLTQAPDIKRMFDTMKPDVVIHLAAVCGGIGANMARPADFFYKNLIMGVQLMEEARIRKIQKFVAIGTICAYPKMTPVPFKEEDLWNGYPEETNAPYGLAKKMLLVQAQAYRKQYGFNAIYLLPVNLYGPGDNFDLDTGHVVPSLIRKFVEAKERRDKEVVCWGTGRASREFFHVRDAAEAIVLAADRYNQSDPVNLGSGEEITIGELAEKIKKFVGFNGEIRWETHRTDGQPKRRLDTSKAKALFGFSAQIRFDEGLRETIDWFIKNRSEKTFRSTPCSV